MIFENYTGTNDAMVDSTHLAIRLNGKPIEILGAAQYAVEGPKATVTFSTAAIAFSFANMSGSNGNSLLIRNVGVSYYATNPTASGLIDIGMYINRSLTVNDAGGTKIAGSGTMNGRKRGSIIAGPTYIDCRVYLANAACTKGTYTQDDYPFRIMNGYIASGSVNNWNNGYPPSVNNLFSCQNSGYPLVLAPGEGFNLQWISGTFSNSTATNGFIVDCFEVATPWS